MKASLPILALALGLLRVGPGQARAEDAKPAVGAGVVTITGSLMCEWATLPEPKASGNDQSNPEHGTLVIYAVNGSPEIQAEVDAVMKACWPAGGALDADAAVKLQEQWTAQLKFYVTKEGAGGEELYKRRHSEQSFGYTLTGTVAEKEGRKWITVSKAVDVAPQQYGQYYPKQMLAPDKPLVMPDKEPLVLKVSDALTLTCIQLPPGKYLEGSSFFMHQRFVEEFPHLVTITKPFYLSEIPITQGMFDTLMGIAPDAQKDPKLPVRNPKCADIQKFCQLLSEKTGRKVRLPTDAEWEYANRVGTSSPPLAEKYADQYVGLPGRMTSPVKSKHPNAWGFYDMASGWWEVVADKGFYNPRTSQVDQFFPADESNPRHTHRGRGLWAPNHSGANVEFGLPANPEFPKNFYASLTFRVAVDAETAK